MGHQRESWESAKVETKKGLSPLFGRSQKTNSGESSEEESSSKPVFWPRNFLVEDIPRAKIWTFGCDVKVVGNVFRDHNTNNVEAHARDFCNQLEMDNSSKVLHFN